MYIYNQNAKKFLHVLFPKKTSPAEGENAGIDINLIIQGGTEDEIEELEQT
ncbi:MAG: hypothetical protein KBT27_05350 [Prevotellaceae bacterium]|nr:hypothetical protein [Candidatus Faecinaster equi]